MFINIDKEKTEIYLYLRGKKDGENGYPPTDSSASYRKGYIDGLFSNESNNVYIIR